MAEEIGQWACGTESEEGRAGVAASVTDKTKHGQVLGKRSVTPHHSVRGYKPSVVMGIDTPPGKERSAGFHSEGKPVREQYECMG